MLRLEGIEKRYGWQTALHELHLDLGPGVFLVVGGNGAGKTTLLRILAGIVPPTRGQVLWEGEDIWLCPERYRSQVGYKPQDVRAPTAKSVRQALEYFGRLKQIPERVLPERVEWALGTCELDEVSRRPLRELSKGIRQRFFLAQALLADPDVLVLDEPLSGLDILGRRRFVTSLREWAEDRLVVLSTHQPGDVEAVAARVIVLHEGRVRRIERV